MNLAPNNPAWVPAYQIKRHQRAKHVKLRYSASSGLKITVPSYFNMKNLPSILESHREWILQQVANVQDEPPRPTLIQLSLLGKQWVVVYEPKRDRPRLRELRSGELVLNVDEAQPLQVTRLLKSWLRRKAGQHLPALFESVSLACQLSYRSLSIRSQSSVWGSCSQDHSIRLNDRLLFFPLPLARHIMIHELCHTKFMNHSQQFWGLVRQFDPDYETHKKQCRHFHTMLPVWAQ